jgi:hypothetical protein
MRKKKIKCNQCHQEQETTTIFIHIVECDNKIRHYAKSLIAELERELRE